MLATCFVQPLDLVKTRMQVCVVSDRTRPSSLSVLLGVVKNEGPRTLYKGLTAGLLRQATYTTTRLGKFLIIQLAKEHCSCFFLRTHTLRNLKAPLFTCPKYVF